MESNEEIILQSKDFVQKKLSGEGTGHDWWHTERVWKTALVLGQEEKADLLVVQLAALLHDLADWKFHDGDETVGPRQAQEWLKQFSLPDHTIKHICKIIAEVSFKGAGVPTIPSTIEGKVVQDADRLDALGAVGIARAFAYGGSKQREIHNPHLKPYFHQDFNQYKSQQSTTINHFYEKLLLLKELMNTSSGKKLAHDRHLFMEQFLAQFYDEWSGKK